MVREANPYTGKIVSFYSVQGDGEGRRGGGVIPLIKTSRGVLLKTSITTSLPSTGTLNFSPMVSTGKK